MNSLDLLNKNSKFRLDLDKELGNIDTESLSEEQNIKTSPKKIVLGMWMCRCQILQNASLICQHQISG